jgi:hypothetical protein
MSGCSGGGCEFKPKIDSRGVVVRSADELRLAELWRLVELPKLLEARKK